MPEESPGHAGEGFGRVVPIEHAPAGVLAGEVDPHARGVGIGCPVDVRPAGRVDGNVIHIGQAPVTAGDQVVLDGHLVTGVVGLDESQLTGESDVVRKLPGDDLFSGSFATTGAGRYVAEKVQGDSLANQITAGARTFRRILTPLARRAGLLPRVAPCRRG